MNESTARQIFFSATLRHGGGREPCPKTVASNADGPRQRRRLGQRRELSDRAINNPRSHLTLVLRGTNGGPHAGTNRKCHAVRSSSSETATGRGRKTSAADGHRHRSHLPSKRENARGRCRSFAMHMPHCVGGRQAVEPAAIAAAAVAHLRCSALKHHDELDGLRSVICKFEKRRRRNILRRLANYRHEPM